VKYACSFILIDGIFRFQKIIDAKYQLHGHTLESVTSAKYLGLTFTNKLQWDQHINCITSKANKSLFIPACVYGSQTVLAYSASGRARVKYACSFILIDGIFRFLRRKPRVLFALLVITEIDLV
jgi:hypothetical protein